jgi:hypothetical protein
MDKRKGYVLLLINAGVRNSRCSSAETQVCHRSYIIAARYNGFLVSFFLKIFHKNDFQVTSDIYVCTCFFLIDYVEGFLYLCQRMSFIFFSVLFLVTAAMLVGARHHRTQF